MQMKKRGISPVIATVLLILLAVVIAVLIFVWARSWFGEKIQKDLGEGMILIEDACKSAGFKAEVFLESSSLKVSIENIKNVPIYGVKIMKVSKGSKKVIGTAKSTSQTAAIRAGQTSMLITDANGLGINDEVMLYPILVGVTQNSNKEHTCADDDIAVTTTVRS